MISQELVELQPTIKKTLDFSSEVKAEWDLRDKTLKSLSSGEKTWEKLPAEERAIVEKYGEIYEDIWDIVGQDCSWYCEAELGKVSASSYLKSQGSTSYDPSNAGDLNYQTAWVEGVDGYGIGEYLEYEFPPTNPRITKVIIVNGYVKSTVAYNSNSRVKKLKMYVDGKPYAILSLKDLHAEQSFEVATIGHGDRSNLEALKQKPTSKIRFEIIDIYKGTKYSDVAISEIYFDGLDVHCLGKGTKITLADGTMKNIESLAVGEMVLSYNETTDEMEPSKILELASPIHRNLIRLTFADGQSIVATEDHPFFDGQKWRSYDPHKTQTDYKFDNVYKLKAGDILQSLHNCAKIIAIDPVFGPQQTFTIVQLERNNSFIANGIIVGTEELRVPKMILQSTQDKKVTE